jgi:hypothetical protein
MTSLKIQIDLIFFYFTPPPPRQHHNEKIIAWAVQKSRQLKSEKEKYNK